jgi:acylphosphatase
MENEARAHVIISGRVQGVCFRMETQRAAKRTGVSGWVKNRFDGTVEAVFEGDRKHVDQIIEWCRKGPPLSVVSNLEIDWESFTGEFKGFDITY